MKARIGKTSGGMECSEEFWLQGVEASKKPSWMFTDSGFRGLGFRV